MIRSRFGAFTPARVVAGDHDLSGRNVVVTGGASGIGYETAKALAAAGADGMLAVRDATSYVLDRISLADPPPAELRL